MKIWIRPKYFLTMAHSQEVPKRFEFFLHRELDDIPGHCRIIFKGIADSLENAKSLCKNWIDRNITSSYTDSKCPFCKEGTLDLEPWHPEQYQCDKCDSTFCVHDVPQIEDLTPSRSANKEK